LFGLVERKGKDREIEKKERKKRRIREEKLEMCVLMLKRRLC
jgi:hypothetical protein